MASIRLQASDVSPIDDIVVEGQDPSGIIHRVSIGVRRDPHLVKSEESSVPLFRDYLRIVIDNWPEVSSGTWSMALAAATQRPAQTELNTLAASARSVPNSAEFAALMARPGATNAEVRGRLDHVKDLVRQAATGLTGASSLSPDELTWRLLSCLKVHNLRLEGTNTRDQTTAVAALRKVIADDSVQTADTVFLKIAELTRAWAARGSVITEPMLRKELSGYGLKRSSSHARAWDVLDRFGVRLRDSIRPGLGAEALEFERADERARLESLMRNVGESGGSLVVTGEPDVGKSALSLRVLEALRSEGASVVSLSLRDLPPRVAEFEALLGGAPLSDVLSTGAARPRRLLLIDGSESVLEGRRDVFRELAAVALETGLGVVAITRTDGAGQVLKSLVRASEIAGTALAPVQHVVGPLSEEERRSLPDTFGALARLSGDPRAEWLLGRPGLVDALLRSGRVVEPTTALCEADVFSAVWRDLVRQDEVHEPGAASADDREQAALSVARRTLGLLPIQSSGTAAAELKSDGVLRVPHDPAFSSGDEFSTDLFRDFALCRLFIRDGWNPLADAGAPRWAIRAARLACQAFLNYGDRRTAWATLVARFDQIAHDHGDRWVEVPYEALLTLGDAESAIRDLWVTLTEGGQRGLRTLLRLAHLRYVKNTIGDPFALAPIVKAAFGDRPVFDQRPGAGRSELTDAIRSVVLAWLRGMAVYGRGQDELRQTIRDVVLDGEPQLWDEFTIEALAMLGPDIDGRSEAWLRDVGEQRPSSLYPAVESPVVALSMSASRPELLLHLAEAYYIEHPDPDDHWRGMGPLGDGIRDSRHGMAGVGDPQAAWYYGPFFRLLNTVPAEAIAFTNRMLDHAAAFRVEKLGSYLGESEVPDGVELDIVGLGMRRYLGDSQVWAWYRGTTAGSNSCMSALLALERFVDHLHEKRAIPARTIAELLLRECHNLAVPGLLVGFLVRHPDASEDLLDPFLADPDVWDLEIARRTGEDGFRVRDSDADKLTGADLRRHTPHDVVGWMVVNARRRGDVDRLTQLEQVGDHLLENARSRLTGAPGEDEYIAMVEGWAAEFRLENYRASEVDGGVLIEFERPEQVERVLAPRNLELQTTSTLYRFQNRYSRANDGPKDWSIDDLRADLATARSISEGAIPEGFLWPENSLVAVAAAAVRAHALGLTTIEKSDLVWAAEAVMWAAENPRVDSTSYPGTVFPMGADRPAAVAAPLLLLEPFDDLGLDRQRLEGSLRALASSLYDEVRMAYAKGCEPIWDAACSFDANSDRCIRHQPAWDAAVASLADCRLGPWSQEGQRRVPDPLTPPFHETLSGVDSRDLLVNHLRMPVACMVDARTSGCSADDALHLWMPLWSAHQRGLEQWWREGYDHGEIVHHEPIAQRLVEITISGESDVLEAHIKTFAENSKTLHLLLEGLARVFTYDARLRLSLPDFWPWAMRVALDAIGDGTTLRAERHWFDYAVAAILPVPHPRSSDPDIGATLQTCRGNWIQPDALEGLDERWLRLAQGEPKAVDAVVTFARSAPRAWQTTTALTWIESIIGGRFDLFANRIWLLGEWFTDLHEADAVTADVRAQYHRIVDGLAAAGDQRAVRLQQLDE
ncbi:ATP-binding protein [Sinomonas sp. JGH33]|uniref:ATP-binding protein n=1 Tax=Sinomonas terricola TaxID=3110330 RepID=A0ABU5TAX0_9MICC|nr:ATP-binding protein [Sinomonas sp. JGH33]MEA5456790.1 ATP-binding protein [Sinomonas sp. JGH33]